MTANQIALDYKQTKMFTYFCTFTLIPWAKNTIYLSVYRFSVQTCSNQVHVYSRAAECRTKLTQEEKNLD